MRVVLASASPARLSTLRAAGIEPDVIVSGVDESQFDESTTADLTLVLAEAKARAVASRPEVADADLVIGCDSLLDFAGRSYGKPETTADAAERWRAMRGSHGTLMTGHVVIEPSSGRIARGIARTEVFFAELTDAEIDAYVATKEPLVGAGAFTIDGLGGAFVTRIDGDHHNVVGLSLSVLRDLVMQFGVTWPELWTTPSGNVE